MKFLSLLLFTLFLAGLTCLPAQGQLIIYPADESAATLTVYSNSDTIKFYTTTSGMIASITDASTDWGYGSKENYYNDLIVTSIENYWGNYQLPITPVIVKATIAVESSFNTSAVSSTGYAGLMQLGTTEASQRGLSLKPSDERFIPSKNIKAGLETLKIKHGVIINPLGLYSDKPWAVNVNNFYEKYGYPTEYQQWALTLAAYNGGGATVVRAMSYAIDEGKDPRVWSNLLNSSNPKSSPLYKSIVATFGSSYASEKYWQMAEYPVKILNLSQK